jgi:hypothetical protein
MLEGEGHRRRPLHRIQGPLCSFRSLVFTFNSHTMPTHPLNSISHLSPDGLLTAMQNVTLSSSPGTDTASSDDSPPPFRPFVLYTHAQILFLYHSPLVSPPQGMPFLKDWFGYAIPYLPFLSQPISSSENGMNKMRRKRIPILLPPLQEPGINGVFHMRYNL